MEKLSVVIITFNEEENIERCIESVADIADEILIVDSFSTDRTVEIAREKGAKVIQNKFEGFREQRAFATQNAGYDFILALDCDEMPNNELQLAIAKEKVRPRAKAYQLNRLSAIGNTFIYYGNWHPDWKLRLFFREIVTFGGNPPHDKIEPIGGVIPQKIPGKLLHFSDKTKTDRYIAVDRHSTTASEYLFVQKKKTDIFKIIFKPVFRFIKGFFLKFGFLDRELGFFVAKSEAMYVFLREKKLWHLWNEMKKKKHE